MSVHIQKQFQDSLTPVCKVGPYVSEQCEALTDNTITTYHHSKTSENHPSLQRRFHTIGLFPHGEEGVAKRNPSPNNLSAREYPREYTLPERK
jgi:hypothetical protein